MEQVMDFSEALAAVLRAAEGVRSPAVEVVALPKARGRVLAGDLLSDRDQPAFDRSTRDGFALRAGGGAEREIVGMVRAGEQWAGAPLTPGQAVEIMTGAPMPAGADAVLMVEHAEVAGGVLRYSAERAPQPGQNIVPRGAEMRQGEVALAAGTVLGASEIASAAAIGAARVEVYRRPRVAILATGDELVDLHEDPGPQQIRNSNSYALAALVEEAGGEAVRMPIVRDHTEDLEAALREARSCDLIVFSGGVSMGKFDLVEGVLEAAVARTIFTGVRMQPGKPVVFGVLGASASTAETFFFGLPGNPVSTQVTFLCFVRPLLRALCGNRSRMPLFVQATLSEAAPGRPGLTRLLPAVLTSEVLRPSVRVVPWQGSGDLGANARANGYVVLPPERERFAVGEIVTVLLR